ncbi:MAG: SCO family protein [Candidatus Rokuibacteriota bacterium]
MGGLGALALALVASACSGAPRELPAFSLTDQSGRSVRADDLRGRVLIVSFIFTTCVEACPITTAQLVRVQAQARQAGLARLRFVSISIDPVTDTPERLRAYATAYGADLGSWSFLTGPPDEVARLMLALEVGTAPGKRGSPTTCLSSSPTRAAASPSARTPSPSLPTGHRDPSKTRQLALHRG